MKPKKLKLIKRILQACPCGSGLRLADCCITSSGGSVKLRVRASDVLFRSDATAHLAIWVQAHGAKRRHAAKLLLRFNQSNGQWATDNRSIHWQERLPAFLNPLHCDHFLENMCRLLQMVVNGFGVMALDSIPNPDGSYRVKIHNIVLAPSDFRSAHAVYRQKVIGFYRPEWEELWAIIDNRAKYDPQMQCDGFSKDQLVTALEKLRQYFPWEWIRARYAEALHRKSPEVSLHEDIDCDYERWFPVAPLVRAANGFLCKDPAISALVTLGLEMENIRKVPGWEELLSRIGKRGFLFQALLTSHFSRLGKLIAVERQSGNTQDDLVLGPEHEIGIEVKTMKPSKLDAASLNKIMSKKSSKLPKSRDVPLLIVVFPIEDGYSGEQLAELVKTKTRTPGLSEVAQSIDYGDLVFPPSIQGILLCGCLVDGTGPVRFEVLRELSRGPGLTISRVKKLLRENRPLGVPRFYLPHTPNFVMPRVEADWDLGDP